jgi:hypothetical protein
VSWVGTVSSQPRWLGWVQPKIFNNNIIILKKEKEKEKEKEKRNLSKKLVL